MLKRQAGVAFAPKDLRASFITFLMSDENSDEVVKKAVAHAMRHSTAQQASPAYDKERAERTWAAGRGRRPAAGPHGGSLVRARAEHDVRGAARQQRAGAGVARGDARVAVLQHVAAVGHQGGRGLAAEVLREERAEVHSNYAADHRRLDHPAYGSE